jgi:hypothetical protein
MKFALNGALTIGTLDGANVDIRALVGAENFFLFGLSEEQVTATRAAGYDPRAHYERNGELRQALDQIAAGAFSPREPDLFRPIVDGLLHHDEYLLLADYESYLARQDEVEQVYRDPERWTRMSILNTARCGYFSSDRSIRDYAEQIWKVGPVDVAVWRRDREARPREDGRRMAQSAGIELSEAEWRLLTEAPTAVSSAIMAATDSGLIGTALEEGAISHAPASAARRYAANPLIKAVLQRMKEQTRTYRKTYRARSRDQAEERVRRAPRKRGLEESLQLCAQVAGLLARTVPAPQAAEYKDWLLAIGEAVATAATEGGFLAVGGEAGDAHETAALRALREALWAGAER